MEIRLIRICPYETESSVDTMGLHPRDKRGYNHVQRRRGFRPSFQPVQRLRGSWRLHPGLYRRDAGVAAQSHP